MKFISKLSLLVLFTFMLNATMLGDELVLIKTGNPELTLKLISNPAFNVHHYKDDFVIATTSITPKETFVHLASQPWTSEKSFYILYIGKQNLESYLQSNPENIEVLYAEDAFAIIASDEKVFGQVQPYKSDGLVRIQPIVVTLPKKQLINTSRAIDTDPFVEQLLAQVEASYITSTVQHLENYGTRNAYTPQSVTAQNWIKDQFQSMGLSVEVMDFNMPSGNASDNVIATLTGTKYPEEYVICGGHYDSYSNSGGAPGADDNASGTAGVIEIARILSQYTFDRTIVFCAFSGEEYGLYGSAAYASRAAQQNMDIHGYFNLDMIGYLKPGNTTIKSTLIYPSSAQELAEFYTEVSATYLPDFVVQSGSLSGGDSDHTSFNNNGFMGIFPFEAVPDYSPYIHTSNDLVGPSYNNAVQAGIFTKASLASIVTMANRLNPPRGLTAISGDQMVELNWSELVDAAYFNIYRNDVLLTTSQTNHYFDLDVMNGTQYQYYITAIYSDSGLESPPSNIVNVTPMPPLVLPLMINFENGAPYWEFTDSWGVTSAQSYSPQHSMTESPSGQYQNNIESYAYLRPFSLNLGYTSANLSFWTKFDLETSYDYMYLEITTNGSNWTQLGQYNGTQNTWQQKNYSLDTYLGNPYVQIRFRFESDYTVTKEGMFIDDFLIQTEGGNLAQSVPLFSGWNSLSSYIVPTQNSLSQVFAELGDNLIAVQTIDGVYIPQQGINTIGYWDAALGYKIKVSNPASLTIAGANQANNLINLNAGWNLIPVVSACEVELTNLLQNVGNQVIIVKEIGSNQVFWPETDVQTLQTLMPGKAYLVKCNQPVQLEFPTCKKDLGKTVFKSDPTELTITSNTHIVAIAEGALEFSQQGDQIIAFNSDGLACGMLTVMNPSQVSAVALFGNDSLSSTIDGFMPGETIIWKLRETSTGFYYDLIAEYDGLMPDLNLYSHEGLSRITHFERDVTSIAEKKEKVTIYPNPVSNKIKIECIADQIKSIELISSDGKKMMILTLSENSSVDVSMLKPGLYFLKIITTSGVVIERIIKE